MLSFHLGRRPALALLIGIGVGFAALTDRCRAEPWPSQSIKIISPMAAGSGPDILNRLIAEKLTRALGQTVFVENRPGAANVVATQAAARAPADGNTLFFGPSLALAVNPHTFKRLPYDPAKDFIHISMIGKTAFFLLAHPSVSVQSLPDVVALEKGKPGNLSIVVDGPRNSFGLLATWLNQRASIGLQLISYTNNPQGVQDAIAGRVPLAMLAGLVARSLIQEGRLRPLAVSSSQRLPGFESVPTMAESMPGIEFIGWFVLSAPAGTPSEVVNKINREMEVIMRDSDLVSRLHEFGFYTDGAGSVASVTDFVNRQRQDWARIVSDIGLSAE
jgi:tripartite-type tricarboxylate transporter receptor subunit TctC